MRRFHRDRDKQPVIDALIADGKGPFSQIWQVMIFASALGFRIQKKIPLKEADSNVAIPPSVFSNNCPSWPGYIYLLNLVETSNPNVFNNDDSADERRIRLLEEYANGGLEYIRDNLDSHNYSIDSVCRLIAQLLHKAQSTDQI
jgi:dnd system-associated protein 4